MGISTIFKSLDREFRVIEELDMDKTYDSGLWDTGRRLPEAHPFRQVIEVFDSGSENEDLIERAGKALGPVEEDAPWVIAEPDQMADFAEYVRGDVTEQWEALAPTRKPGIVGWAGWQFGGKERHALWEDRRDDYRELLEFLSRAIESDAFVVREMY